MIIEVWTDGFRPEPAGLADFFMAVPFGIYAKKLKNKRPAL